MIVAVCINLVKIVYSGDKGLSSEFFHLRQHAPGFHPHPLPRSPPGGDAPLTASNPPIIGIAGPRDAEIPLRPRFPTFPGKIVVAIIPECGTVTGKNPFWTSTSHQGAEK